MNFDSALKRLDKLNLELINEQNIEKWSQDEQETLDPKDYIEQYLYIKTKDARLDKLKLNDPQAQIYNIIKKQRSLNKPIRIIVLKARQEGVSTLTEALIFEDTINRANINSLIVAHDTDSSDRIFAMSKLYYDMLPDARKPATNYSNRKELDFKAPLLSRIQVDTAGNTGVGRSFTLQNFHGSEVAFWKDA